MVISGKELGVIPCILCTLRRVYKRFLTLIVEKYRALPASAEIWDP